MTAGARLVAVHALTLVVTLASCSEQATTDAPAAPPGPCEETCARTERTTCEHLLDGSDPRGVSVVVDGAELGRYGGFDRICDDFVRPFEFLTNPEAASREICGDRDRCPVRVCGRVHPDLRDRVTGRPLFIVCEYELADLREATRFGERP